MRRLVTAGAIAALGIAGFASPALAAGGPSASTGDQANASVPTAIGMSMSSGGINFGTTNPGGKAVFAYDTFIVTGNDNYALTVQDTPGSTATGSMVSSGAAALPWNALWFCPVHAPNAGTDFWLDVQGNTDNAGDSCLNTSPGLTNAGETATGEGPVVALDSTQKAGTFNEVPPPAGGQTYQIDWGLQVPANAAPGSYSTTIVYSVTGQ